MSDELDLDAVLGDIPRPRDQHYVFAHVVLPQVMSGHEPSRVDLAGQAADVEFFRTMWDELADLVEGEPIPNAGLEVTYRKADELEAMILTLPKAEVPGEAIMVAVVRRPVRRWLLFSGHALRYFTLELGLNLTDDLQLAGHRTVLCEWSKGGHRNYGDGPDAEVDLFATAVFAKCSA
ncbi:MAG: hypothetical protein R6X02_08600 [Enhygromyxa sp.]